VRALSLTRLTAGSAAVIALLAAGGVLGLRASIAAQSRPCTCDPDDLEDVQRKLDLTRKQLDAWKTVLDEVQSGAPGAATSGDGAGERFCTLTGQPKDCVKPANKDKSRAGGVNPDTLEPEINPTYAAAHCDIVVDSVDYHEQMHPRFFDLNRFNYRVILGVLGWNYKGGARVMCWNEMFAHEEQILFLEEKKADLERQCQPAISAYPTAGQKEEQKQRVAAAEKRVTAYAQTIG
jgi:hypothetical protein